MRQLSGMDEFLLLHETGAQPLHTIKIAVVDPSTATSPVTYESTRQWVARRFPEIPPLRWRLIRVPLGLARPFWIDAPDLDLGYHVRRAAVPSPGGDAEFDEVISWIASVALDHTKPLWQLWFVEGLGNGCLAFVLKIHHALADGFASLQIFEQIFGAEDLSSREPGVTAPAAPVPSARERTILGLRSQLRVWRGLPSLMRRTNAAFKAGRARKQAGGLPVTKPLSAPLTRFNRPLTTNRIYVNVTVPLADVRQVHDAFGCTINDVFVAMCGGALRRYLQERDELPGESLIAVMPVSIRHPDQVDDYGNRVSYWYLSLATDVEDTASRLAAIRDTIQAAREWNQGDVDLPGDWEQFTWFYTRVLMGLTDVAERASHKAIASTVVSNVRGPRPLSHNGATVVAVRSMGPIEGSRGLNFTAWSYRENFAIGLHACREHVPDLRRLGELLATELEALKEAGAVPLSRQAEQATATAPGAQT
jgi:diacylglycerol O-acyltransferase / wax synthase